MEINAATATVIAAVVGAGVGGFVTLLGQWLARRSEERRHLRQLVIKTAVENWRVTSDALEKRSFPLFPLDIYVLHMLKLSEILDKRQLTPELVREKLSEVFAVSDVAGEELRNYTQRVMNEAKSRSDTPPTPTPL
jgi:hypothetical protein